MVSPLFPVYFPTTYRVCFDIFAQTSEIVVWGAEIARAFRVGYGSRLKLVPV